MAATRLGLHAYQECWNVTKTGVIVGLVEVFKQVYDLILHTTWS